MAEFPNIKSTHSLVAKHVTKEKWDKLSGIVTKTSGFTLAKAIACAVEFDNQHCGIYAGDGDSYRDFADVFTPLICEYHGLPADFKHTSDMDCSKITGNVNPEVPVHSCRIRVGRSIEGFGLSPGITQEQRVGVEALMKNAFTKLPGDLAGNYYPLTGMDEKIRQQLVDDHFLFVSGDRNLTVAGMERDWPEGRGIFHNEAENFFVFVNEEDQMRIVSMQKGASVVEIFKRFAAATEGIQKVLKQEGYDFMHNDHLGWVLTCPSNLGTGLRAGAMVQVPKFSARADFKQVLGKMGLQARGTAGVDSASTGGTWDISNADRLGKSETQLVNIFIEGVAQIIRWEQALEAGTDIEAEVAKAALPAKY